MDMGKAPANGGGMNGMPMSMDLNDIQYDAFLANDRTLDDPLTVKVERNGRVRLRLINGANHGFDAKHPLTKVPPVLEKVVQETVKFFLRNATAKSSESGA